MLFNNLLQQLKVVHDSGVSEAMGSFWVEGLSTHVADFIMMSSQEVSEPSGCWGLATECLHNGAYAVTVNRATNVAQEVDPIHEGFFLCKCNIF